MVSSEPTRIRFAPYRQVLDHKKIEQYLNMVIEGETKYESPRELACNLWNRRLAGEFYPDKPTSSQIPTCDLVKEIATREGVTEYVAGPQDRYLVRTKADDGISRVDFDLGPAVILVVVD